MTNEVYQLNALNFGDYAVRRTTNLTDDMLEGQSLGSAVTILRARNYRCFGNA